MREINVFFPCSLFAKKQEVSAKDDIVLYGSQIIAVTSPHNQLRAENLIFRTTHPVDIEHFRVVIVARI